MPSDVRADNLGSLLRPSYLLDARHDDAPLEELRPLEDRAIEEAIALQEDVGLPVVTDGEYRRRFFFSTIEFLFDGIDATGFVRHHRDFEGVQHELRTPTPVARLTRRGSLVDYELSFVRERTDRLVKVTLPCPSMFPNYWSPGVSEQAYADRDAYLEHLVELMNEDAKALAAAGVDYIQLDNRVLDGVDGVMTGIHICRGNDRSHFTGTEPYDDLAAAIFPHVSAERLLLEYDDERSGGFEPLRHARD